MKFPNLSMKYSLTTNQWIWNPLHYFHSSIDSISFDYHFQLELINVRDSFISVFVFHKSHIFRENSNPILNLSVKFGHSIFIFLRFLFCLAIFPREGFIFYWPFLLFHLSGKCQKCLHFISYFLLTRYICHLENGRC